MLGRATRNLVAPAILLSVLAAASGEVGGQDSSMTAAGAAREQEVTFTSDGDTIAGSLLLPGVGEPPWPAAVILSGSGPTDRNGNSALVPGSFDTNRNFAEALAALGVASLRYDKLGTGATGLAGRDPSQIGVDVFLDEAQAAYAYLRGRPEIDPDRVFFLGHSEGALLAMAVATRLPADQRPRLLVLAAPTGFRYLDVIRRQIGEQYAAAVAAGQVPQSEADATLAELDRLIAGLRQDGMLPSTIESAPLRMVFSPTVARFLTEADALDPRTLAEALSDLPVLLLRGGKDQQVSAEDVERIEAGLRDAGNTRRRTCQPANANHVFKDVPGVPNPALDYGNPDLPFSPEAVACLTAFLREYLVGS
jgi:alpha-beta hydrolase superfamily lysophospholipase